LGGVQEYFPAQHYPRGGQFERLAAPGFNIPVDNLFDEAANLKALMGAGPFPHPAHGRFMIAWELSAGRPVSHPQLRLG
jgi:hypothetical protein